MNANDSQASDSSPAKILVGMILAAAIVALTVWLISFLSSRRDGGSFGFVAWPLEN